jgi:hypothetical protein
MRPGARVAVGRIFDGILSLRKVYEDAFEEPDGKFPIDGRLVGDIGEAIAAVDYGVKLHPGQYRDSDGTYSGAEVEVKATFQDNITFTKPPARGMLVLCFQLHKDGRYVEAYNGPSEPLLRVLWRKGKTKQRRPLVKDLRRLSDGDEAKPRIPRVRD